MKSKVVEPKEIKFANPRLKSVGIELLHLSDLRDRVSAHHLATPERAEFFMLLLITHGYLRHTVDFIDMRLGAGSLVFVRPGQVQHWHLDLPVQGCMVLIDPPALLPVVDARRDHDTLLMAMEEWPAGVRLDDDFAKDLQADLQRLASDIAAYDGAEHDAALIRHVLLSVMLRIARWHRARQQPTTHLQSATQEAYRLFRRELEKQFRLHWRVSQYAVRLGFSESTLNRACLTAVGQTAKVMIDRRVALEAARMLAHSAINVAQVSHALGFSEPTNFVRFFTRMIGTTPTLFRTQRALTETSPHAT